MAAVSTILAANAAALALVAAGIGGYSAVAQADASKRAGEFNARLAERNAILAARAGQRQTEQIQQQARRLRGRQLAKLGKAGVTASGSALDVIADSERQFELDALAATYRGSIEAEGARLQGAYAKQQARAQANAAYFSGAGSVLSGLGSAAGSVSTINFE